jgi:hypothetical protein
MSSERRPGNNIVPRMDDLSIPRRLRESVNIEHLV